MRKEITFSEEAIGKIIEGVAFEYSGTRVLITFTDNTFAILEISYEEIQDANTLFDISNFGDMAVVRLGVATQKEIDEARLKKTREWHLKQNKQKRELYEELKREFGDG